MKTVFVLLLIISILVVGCTQADGSSVEDEDTFSEGTLEDSLEEDFVEESDTIEVGSMI